MQAFDPCIAAERVAQVARALVTVQPRLRLRLAHARERRGRERNAEGARHGPGELERLVEAALAQARTRERRHDDEPGMQAAHALRHARPEPASRREIARELEALHQAIEREAVLEARDRFVEGGGMQSACAACSRCGERHGANAARRTDPRQRGLTRPTHRVVRGGETQHAILRPGRPRCRLFGNDIRDGTVIRYA